MKYRLGLDIGIASVGWSVIEHDDKDNPCRIVDLGVRTFTPAEKPKDGSSLAVDRREARGLRRRLRRRAFRVELAKKYLTTQLLNGKADSCINRDIYRLRCVALDSLISNEELYSVILHFVKHRGFKSNRKSENSGTENGKVINSITQNQEYIKLKGYRTIGECIFNDEKYFVINTKGEKEFRVRNHPVGGAGNYENSFLRADLEQELRLILETQSKLGNAAITPKFIEDVVFIFNKQRSFDEGPNEPSKYKANFAVGKDLMFEPQEYRAPKGSFTFEYFNLLQKLNHLNIVNGSDKRKLSSIEIALVLEQAFKGKDIKFKDLRKMLNLSADETFSGLTYFVKNGKDLTKEEIISESEKSRFFQFKFSKEISKILELDISETNAHLFDAIGLIFSMRKSDAARINALKLQDEIVNRLSGPQVEALQNLNLNPGSLEKLLHIETSEFASLSFKAMNNIIDYLKQGLTYDKACESAGYNFNNAYGNTVKKIKIEWKDLSDELQEITSPVVLRSVSQTVKVVNAVIDKYGSPSAIFVELSREMSKNFSERKKIEKENETRKQDNERIEALIKEMGIIPTGQDIVKYRLYIEQDGKCAYSGKSFDAVLGGVKNIFANNNTQIDHIIPYSKCYDDSYNNKVLVLSSENQLKGNRLPYEYLSDNEERLNNFVAFVQATYKNNHKKMQNLLKKTITIEEQNTLNERALNDTKHASRFVMNMLKNHLIFADSSFNKSTVRAVKGSMTSYLRKIWGLTKVRFENDRHHALDATIVACCTNSMIRQVSSYLKFKEFNKWHNQMRVEYDGATKYLIDPDGVKYSEEEYEQMLQPKIPQPYPHFSNELKLRLSANPLSSDAVKDYVSYGYDAADIASVKEVFVSRMPTRGVKGPIHMQTIRRVKERENEKFMVTKTSLENLTYKNGKIIGYPEENIISDPLLYNALIKRIEEYKTTGANGVVVYDIKSAFKQPFYKPRKNGENGPLVKAVKIEDKGTDYVSLKNKSAAANGSMVRIDVFTKNNKNYFVPIYTADVYKGVLPNRAAVAHKAKDKWLVMDETFTFRFSLYPNDLILVKSAKGLKGKYSLSKKPALKQEVFVYYNSANIANASISFESTDSEIEFEGVGIQGILLEKYVVDVLGNISKVKSETRQPLNLKSESQKEKDRRNKIN